MIGRWTRDLAFGARLAIRGGATGWTRMVLTAAAIGLGVAFLLLAAAVPNVLEARDARIKARIEIAGVERPPRSDDTLLVGRVDTRFKGKQVRGRLLQPEGPAAPAPPGVAALPRPGQMVVSPALAELLASSRGALLRPRLNFRVVGSIGDRGLAGPDELAFYAGSDRLDGQPGVERLVAFGSPARREGLGPQLVLLVIVGFVAVLLPVAVFMAAAARFGSASRDRRLAALRLVGADLGMTRRFAVGEALGGGVLGLALGALFFLGVRRLAGLFTFSDISVFPADVRPGSALVGAIAIAVPALSVAVTLSALRSVMIEPMGVVRREGPDRRRLWWRLLLPVTGLLLLLPLLGDPGSVSRQPAPIQLGAGAILLLVGVAALLPWLLAAAVRPLGAGGVPWQLAVRRIQMDTASSARLVSGVAVAVAGAIALQTLVAGMQTDFADETGANTSRAQLRSELGQETSLARVKEIIGRFAGTPGVRSVLGVAYAEVRDPAGGPVVPLVVGSCARLRSAGRFQVMERADGVTIVNDAYNANPQSMRAGLHSVAAMAEGRRTIAVLGEMTGQATGSIARHEEVGWTAARLNIDILVTVGAGGPSAQSGVGGDGPAAMAEAARAERRDLRIEAVPEGGEALALVRALIRPGDVVYVKASSELRLTELADALATDAPIERR